MAATQIFATFCLTFAIIVTYTLADLREVCQWETFEARCQDDEVILMKSALYGRMHVGRCQPRDYFVGCSADVISIMHARCSGRQHCSVQVPDADMFAATNCNRDLVSYLEADYECVKVNKRSEENCDHKTLTDLTGYISNPPVKDSTKKLECPTRIIAQPGQTVNVYLYDFMKKQTNIEVKFYQPECINYGYISEDIPDTPFVKICNDELKTDKLIYSSKSNAIDISLVLNNPYNFLIKYEVIGCPIITPPQYSQLILEENIATISCAYSPEVTTLVCIDNQWVGEYKNCTQQEQSITGQISAQSIDNIFALSNFTIVCIGLALGLTCSVSVFVLALRYLNNSKKQESFEIPEKSLIERVNDFRNNRQSCDVSLNPLDQYHSIYVPVKHNSNSQYMPLTQLKNGTFCTFQPNIDTSSKWSNTKTVQNHPHVNDQICDQLVSVHNYNHHIYDISDLGQKKIGQNKVMEIDHIV